MYSQLFNEQKYTVSHYKKEKEIIHVTIKIPNITPNITLTRDDAINLILFQLFGGNGFKPRNLCRGERLQYVLGTFPGLTGAFQLQ